MFKTVLQLIFGGSVICQLLYWLSIFSKLAFFSEKNKSNNDLNDSLISPTQSKPPPSVSPVSVIICARNEAQNIEKNLPLILYQDYPDYEVIVVNDASTDETSKVLERLTKAFKHLRVVTVQEKKIAGKKGALAFGIDAARHDLLLLTDADCYPLSETPKINTQWIANMVKGINAKDIGLAYAPYQKRDGFLNTFIRFETVWTATQYMGLALAGFPYMGVGRNMIYKKSLYEKVDGFQKHEHIASGDDDLFVNSVISEKNFKIILNPQTFMVSEPKTQWNEYFTQKKRHLSTATSYTLKHKMILGMLSASHFLYFVTAVLLLALEISTIFVVLSVVVRTIVIWYLYGKILRKLHESNLILWIPLLDVVYILFYIVFLPALTHRTQKWR